MADLDGDGSLDLVLSVSYFFEAEEMGNTATRRTDLPVDVETSKYVAGGVVVFDLDKAMSCGDMWRCKPMKWSVHLDLTTDAAKLRAYIYSAPTLIDLDADGSLEVIVGTSVGFIYVLNAAGETLPGFPVQIGEIQGQVAAEDVTVYMELTPLSACSNSL